MSGPRVETPTAYQTGDVSRSIDRASIAWLEWGIQLANDLHRLPQNASRRQRRLLSSLCARLDTDAGSTTVFAGVDPEPSDAATPPEPVARPTPALRRMYFVGHDMAAPSATLKPSPAGRLGQPESTVTAAEPVASVDAHAPSELTGRLAALPAAWTAQHAADAVGFSLIRLADDRVSLLELRRRPHGSEPARAFDAGTLAAMAAVHRACAWACDASPLLGMTSVPGLSPRERETLDHLLAGASEKEVAALLRRSPHTVHSYIKRIYRQLGVRSRAELLAIFVDAGGRN